MKIEITVPALGEAKGTLGHTANELAKTILTVSAVRGGGIGLFAHEQPAAPDEKPTKTMLVWYHPGATDQTMYYNDWNNGFYAVYAAENSASEGDAFWFNTVTPAAETLIDKFLLQCVTAFKTRIESDGDDSPMTIELVSSELTPA